MGNKHKSICKTSHSLGFTCNGFRPYFYCLGLAYRGICKEGNSLGLGVFRGRVLRFPPTAMRTASGARLKVPEMGWNRVYQTRSHPLWEGIADGSWFYLVHSYFAAPEDMRIVAGMTSYGLPYTTAVAKGNIFATQFHPEKSAADGLRLYSNFLRWNP